ncbi:MAG TPA: AmmeMemoRadiSam system protein B [Micromonosporaceae bacterium]|nr:AmmeMemoRadiSam system protein B [Micromonosporaceae bacterium]
MSRAGRWASGSRYQRSTRPPAVAGSFYPGDPHALAGLVDRMLDAVDVPAGDRLAPAYCVPHAGYRYSGPTAAHTYARLRAHADRVSRVVILGPAHHTPLRGCAVPTTDGWVTPLGDVAVDVTAARTLAADGHVVADDGPHAPEHSVEVQVPFLQRALPGGVPILPILVGRSTVEDLVVTIEAAVELAPPGTVLLCSTDLSHYLADDAARRQDARTARAVLDLAPERIGVRDACGVYALRGTVGWARHRGLRPQLLDLSTSADTSGDTSRVVGYAAFAFEPS